MKHYPVRIKIPHNCERCNNEIKRGERCYYYYISWRGMGINKKVYCHKSCKRK